MDNRGPCGRFRFRLHPEVRVGLVTLARKRPWPSCVNPATGNQWSEDMKVKIDEVISRSPFEVVRIPEEAVKVVDDPSLREAIKFLEAAEVDVLVAVQPVISDGRLAPVLAQVWEHPVVLWATPEEQTGEMISGNSLVGTHLMSATLRQLGFEVETVFANLDWQLAEVQLIRGVRIAFAKRFLAKAKVGLVGYQAPGFQDFHPDPFRMRKTFGTIMLHLGLGEYKAAAASITAEDFEADLDKVKSYGWPLAKGATSEDVTASTKHYVAMKSLIAEHNLDAIAVRCWPEMPNDPGLDSWCYMALARLATEGFPIACEGDVDGALGCLIGKLLGFGAVYLSDWLEHEANSITLWHGGMAPTQLCEAVGSPIGPCISRHFNNKKAGCLDATIRSGMEVTVFRFWVFDGRYRLIALEGKTRQPKRHILGNNGLVELPSGCGINLTNDFPRWIQKGFPHHVCVVEGYHAQALTSLARHCNVDVIVGE